MNDSKYRYILYVIVAVIIATIGIQVYWNYKNYLNNKQQLINDVQLSLDKAVDDYYTALAKRTTLGLQLEGDAQKDVFEEGGFLEKITKSIDESEGEFNDFDSIENLNLEGVTIIRGFKADSIIQTDKNGKNHLSPAEFKQQIREIKSTHETDSFKVDITGIEMLTSKIVISIHDDSLDIKEVDSLLKVDLNRKNINLNYSLSYKEKAIDSLIGDRVYNSEISKNKSNEKMVLKTVSNSSFLPKDQTLSIEYNNTTWVVLKRVIVSILISTLLVLAVISCLFYLLKIIKHQKQLAEIKNDLISNITHEFKTPIATIGVALESIQNFNAIEDKDKTKNYLDMSRSQLSKLNTMVEKLLETASLDSEHLELNIDSYNISEVISSIAEKHKLQNTNKSMACTIDENIYANVDVFHFENAINNIVDNAFKYGGDRIIVDLKKRASEIEITIADDGNSLSKVNKEQIFEKFYRVPKGNTHDIKGFGIGLYYTKKIVEKHNGSINLELKNGLTTFKIIMPNV